MDGFREQPLRRTWFRGYRKADVELNLAGLRLLLQATQQEVESARRRADELAAEIRDLRERDAAVRAKEIELVEALSAVRQERERLESEAHSHAREVILDAEARAAEIRSESLGRIEDLQRQTDELMTLRRRLVENVRRAVEEVDAVVRAVETESPSERSVVTDLRSTS